VFFGDFPLIWGFSIAIHTRIHHYFSSFFSEYWIVGHLQSPVGLFQLRAQTSSYATDLLNARTSHWTIIVNFFPVLDPYKLAISLIAFINIVCCLKKYIHQNMQMRFVFVLKMFQDKCNRDCNRDYFQCNRNRLHLCCNRPMSGYEAFFSMLLQLPIHLKTASLSQKKNITDLLHNRLQAKKHKEHFFLFQD